MALIAVLPLGHAGADPAVAEDAAEAKEKAEEANPAKLPTITAKSLHSAMQKAAVKYRADKNKLVNDQRFTTMRDELVKEFGTTSITYRVPIRRVDWKDGVVTLVTDSPLPDVKPSNQNPLLFSGPYSLELKMEKEDAAALQPGDWVTFTGSLTFEPASAVPTSTKAQKQFRVRHYKILPASGIGTFSTVDYTGEINGKVYQGSWQAEDAEE